MVIVMDNSNFNISQNKLDSMLKTASEKLGTSPDKLKNQLKQGNFDALKSNPNLNAILNNPEKLRQILQSEQIQNILRNLNEKNR